jgi:hypothetical protein
MSIDEITAHVASLEGSLILRPQPGDGSPEISWGDVFCYYAPEGEAPTGQPFATVVTKSYPDEDSPELDRPGSFRLNLAVGQEVLAGLTDAGAGAAPGGHAVDTWIVHPVYGHLGWVAVVDPAARTSTRALALLDLAHAQARARHQRRHGDRD